jgi:RNA polymerase sigma-70 factor (ECF subfamily)
MGGATLAWVGRAVTDTVPVVRGLEAFDRFYAREFPAIVNIAHAISGSRMAAEDLAQEAMIRAYRRWPEVGALERPGCWVRRVALNLAMSAYQRRKAEARSLPS